MREGWAGVAGTPRPGLLQRSRYVPSRVQRGTDGVSLACLTLRLCSSAGTTPDALVSGRPIMGRLAVLLGLALAALLAPGAGAPVGRKGARNKLLLVSFDGFRWNYDQDVHTPNLDAMALDGVKARYMTPAFVTMTSPCHFTLVTGEHGPRGGAWGRERVEQPEEGNPPPSAQSPVPRGPTGTKVTGAGDTLSPGRHSTAKGDCQQALPLVGSYTSHKTAQWSHFKR